MFKSKNYYQNKNSIKIPKNIASQDVKSDIKPKINNTYENIRKIIENKEEETISNSNVKDIKNIKNKLNIV